MRIGNQAPSKFLINFWIRIILTLISDQYVGPTVLYASQLAKHCFAIEPDPIAFQELKNNIELNEHLKPHITLSNYCISNSIGLAKLFSHTEKLEYGGGSGSSLIDQKGHGNFGRFKTTIQQFIQSLSITDCNFIKMDLEGAEFDLIPSMSDYLKKSQTHFINRDTSNVCERT